MSKGLKAPLKRALPAPKALASPARAAQPSPDYEEERPPIKQPKLGIGLAAAGRGALTGRPLGRPAPVQSESPEPQYRDDGMSAAEKAELEELRRDKDRLLRQCDDLRQERSRLKEEVVALRESNAQLIEDHTRDMLSVKAKETQLVRARSELEAGEAMTAQLKREMERLKKALNSHERINGADSPRRESMMRNDRDFSNGSSLRGDFGMGEEVYRDTGMYGAPEPRRTGGISRPDFGRNNRGSNEEEKENGSQYGGDGSIARNKLRSPDLLPHNGTSSSGRSPARESFQQRREMDRESRMGGMDRSMGMEIQDSGRMGSDRGLGSERGLSREDSRMGGMDDVPITRGGSGMSGQGGAQPVESWKRAAEVTSALKAKIEQMKVCYSLV